LNFVNNFSEVSAELVQEIKEERQKPKENQDESLVDEIFTDISQNLEKITLHGKRASSIVKGMLEHSRTSTGVKELTDINQLADEYLRLSYHGLRAKDTTFNSDFELIGDENLPKTEVITQDIGRVFLNLINNAFWAVNERRKKGETGYEPKVTVNTQLKANSQVLIAIKDNGTGMTDAVKAKVFQPFFTTKPTGQGTGLGLSLSYDIIKAHGSTIKINTIENEGTEFIIELPL
jgi:two-component system NtrC family sensor kinase